MISHQHTSSIVCVKQRKSMKTYNQAWTYMQTTMISNSFFYLIHSFFLCYTFSILFFFCLPWTNPNDVLRCFRMFCVYVFFNEHHSTRACARVPKHRHSCFMEIQYNTIQHDTITHTAHNDNSTRKACLCSSLISWISMEIEW